MNSFSLGLILAAAQTEPTAPAASFVTAPGVASLELARAGDRERLIVIGADGRVAVVPLAIAEESSDGAEQVVFGEAELVGPTLPNPERCLFTFAPATEGADADLWFTDPRGFHRFQSTEAGFAAESERILRRADFDLLTGMPRSAPLLRDIDGDGRPDLSLPGLDAVGLYWNRTEDPASVVFESGGAIGVRTSLGNEFEDSDLSFRVRSSLVVPQLELEDLNGDGQADLIVQEPTRVAYHLGNPESGFGEEADVVLDLTLFRDNETRRSSLNAGGALELAADATVERRDLNGDGLPDYVVFQGRKLWTFLGRPTGPQFSEPSTILKSAEPITVVVFFDLDADERPELVLLRLEIPTLPSLFLGLFSEFDVPVHAGAYRALENGKFEARPFRSRQLRLRLPPILSVIRDPYALLQKFRGATKRFRDTQSADLDGDGQDELLLLSEARDRLDIYPGRGTQTQVLGQAEIEALLREQLFESEGDVWDTDRLIGLVGDVAAKQVRSKTEGQAPVATIHMDLRKGRSLRDLYVPDANGDGAAELILAYRSPMHPGALRLDLHRVRF